jgi:peptidoglycan/xylan/chitin deacetylase (PgdA/CDA1 family)
MQRKWSLLVISFSLLLLLTLFFLLSSWLPSSQIFGKVIYKESATTSTIYLTFDDGPGPATIEVLSILKEHNVKATFFMTGSQAELYPETVHAVLADGHAIGTHTYEHSFLLARNTDDIIKGKIVLENITNSSIHLFRPPYGFRSPTAMKKAKEQYLSVITWSVFPRDYRRDSEATVHHVCKKLHPGAIIVLHDGPVLRNETVKSIEPIIACAKEQGYVFAVLG